MVGFSFEFLNKPFVWIDPRTKLLAMFAVGFISFQGVPFGLELVLFLFTVLLLINGRRFKSAINLSAFFIVLTLIDIFISPYTSGFVNVIVITLLRMCRMYIPIVIIFIFTVSTTTVSEFVASFERMKISSKITIPFSVMFRFFPTLGEEYKSIKDAMAFRGIGLSFGRFIKNPIKTFEYIIVPLLMSSMTIAEELSAAALSRGLDHKSKRTNVTKVGLCALDYFVITFCITFMVIAFIY